MQIPFAKKWYCHPDFQGAASIKNVLPVLVPELNYANLEIQKGDVAQAKYLEMINMPDNHDEKNTIKYNLLEYCKLDTLAMVKILDVIQKNII